MERHAALPDLEDGERVGEIMGQIVEQHIAEPAAQHHPEGGPEQEIVELLRRDRRAARFPQFAAPHEALGIGDGKQQAEDIGERVPADGERADREGDGVDLGKGKSIERRHIAATLA